MACFRMKGLTIAESLASIDMMVEVRLMIAQNIPELIKDSFDVCKGTLKMANFEYFEFDLA